MLVGIVMQEFIKFDLIIFDKDFGDKFVLCFKCDLFL